MFAFQGKTWLFLSKGGGKGTKEELEWKVSGREGKEREIYGPLKSGFGCPCND